MSDLQWTAGSEDAGVRLDKFLAAGDRLGSRARVLAALDRGKIFLNGAEAAAADRATLLGIGDVVRAWMDRPGSARRRTARTGALDIVYEDDALLVLNKPAGLLVVPVERRGAAPSVYDLVEDHLRPRGKRRPLIVHRIDRDTSGLVVFAKRHEAERVYRAIVYGRPRPPVGAWRDQLVWDRRALIQKETHARDPRGKEAISEYRVLEAFRDASLIEVRLVTGKRNQIRIQARLRGHTLVGERRYVNGPELLRPVAFGRQALHAYRLGFRHPMDERALQFEAPLPADLVELLARLRRGT